MYIDTRVTKEFDSYIKDRDMAIYIAQLSNGETIYQDDDRPNLEPHAWLRLKAYCEESDLYITDLKLKFRSHIEPIQQADGYCLVKSIFGSWASNKRVFHYFKIGRHFKKDGKLITLQKWKIPELIMELEEERSIDEELIEVNYIPGYVSRKN